MAQAPGSARSTVSSKTSSTRPIALCVASAWPSAAAMPALSWPRCCSACSASTAWRAASGQAAMPTMPHSSRQ